MKAGTLSFRTSEALKTKFEDRCAAIGKSPSDMQRELVQAFVDNRVTITPNPEQLALQEIYKDGD